MNKRNKNIKIAKTPPPFGAGFSITVIKRSSLKVTTAFVPQNYFSRKRPETDDKG